jgi:hypothetical protein
MSLESGNWVGTKDAGAADALAKAFGINLVSGA